MNKTISLYIFKDLAGHFLLGLLSLNVILAMEYLVRLTKTLAYVGLSPMDMGALMLYIQPMFSLLSIPMAMFIAILLTYGRMNVDSEITVLKASGLSFFGISMPAFALGLLCFTLALITSFEIGPRGARHLSTTISTIVTERAPFSIKPGIFNDMLPGMVIFAQEKPSPGDIKGIFIHDERNASRPSALFANRAHLSSREGGKLLLDIFDGSISIPGADSSTDLSFGHYRLSLQMPIAKGADHRTMLTPGELLYHARGLKSEHQVSYYIEFDKRLTFPALCLVLMIMGPPLAMRGGRTGKLGGLAIGFAVIASYHGSMVYFEGMVRTGALHHLIGAWTPALVLVALGIYLFRQENAK